MFKGLTIKGQFMYQPRHVVEILSLVGSGLLDLHPLNVREFAWDQLEEGMEAAKGFDRLGNLAIFNPVKA